MPRPRPLSPAEAKKTLANKFAGTRARPGLADRLRQLSTKFGLRSRRVFLVWARFTGAERGEGKAEDPYRVELLPTPRVTDLSSVALNPFSGGKLPVGSVRIDQVSLTVTLDELMGRRQPGGGEAASERIDFWYELVEDGRGDNPAERMRFRLLATPDRQEGKVGWSLLLERASEDPNRQGALVLGDDSQL